MLVLTIQDRFIRYTQFDTQSAENSMTVPSTPKQLLFAKFLKEEMEAEGLCDVVLDDKGYLYATLPANTDKTVPAIGFISHYDTSPDCSGENVKAKVVKDYDGGDIELSPGIWSRTATFPELLCHVGEDLIVTDGTTLLGADDKAGIAAIMHAMAYLVRHPEIEHGTVRVAFNPDEEIVKLIKEGLAKKGGYCPCRMERTEDNKCMCKEFREQIKDPDFEGYCHCRLYYKSK